MRKRVFVVLSVLSLLASCGPVSTTPAPTPVAADTPPAPTPAASTGWQETVDAVNALKPGEMPAHLEQENAVRDGTEFDPNRYFTALPHLSLEPGYTLDYVYYYDGMGGFPVLYARPADQVPYENYAAYAAAVGDPSAQRSSYLDHVRTDGTAEGFFQLVVMQITAGQFYLFWHANYNDAVLVCDQARLEGIIAMMQETTEDLSADVVQQARALDVRPAVEFQGDTVRVRIVTFSRWGGFSEEVYSIGKAFPHQFLDVETKVLVPYNCGIMF